MSKLKDSERYGEASVAQLHWRTQREESSGIADSGGGGSRTCPTVYVSCSLAVFFNISWWQLAIGRREGARRGILW